MLYKYISVLFSILTFISCNTSAKKEEPVTENIVTELIVDQLINQFRSMPEIRVFSDEEKTAYKIDEFVNKHEWKNTFLLDSVKLYPNIRSYIFIEYNSEKMWIVNYDQHLNYIDNRWIYGIENGDTASSVIKIKEKIIYTKDSQMFNQDYLIETKIHSNGIFEDMPDESYVEDMPVHFKDSVHIYTNKEIAFSGCVGIGEKFYPNVEWTAIDFSRRKTEQIKTVRNYLDHLEATITLYKRMSGKQIYDDFYPNIAFRGKHNIELIPLDTLAKDDEYTRHLLREIEIALKDDERIYPKHEDLTEPITSDINYAAIYSPDGDIENSYAIVQLKTERLYNYNSSSISYECLIVVTPSEEIQLLAPHCIYDFYIFKVDGKPHLYTMYTSCGEGAVGVNLLYKINKAGLEKIAQYEVTCD